MMPDPAPRPSERRPSWPWLALVAALAWTALLRIPLIAHARDHLDSDLAVDGLTLLGATQGDWRWHYPGTPHIGIAPVLLSLPQAIAGGLTPEALVSGGLVAWVLVIGSTFLLAWRGFGPSAAAWSLVPLACSSSGVVWLSGRITGGHLFILFWHVAAFDGLLGCLRGGGPRRLGLFGLWCGLGLWHDAMFAFSLLGLIVAAGSSWWSSGRNRPRRAALLAYLVGLALGVAPLEIGRRVDPYDAYGDQFQASTRPDVLAGHAQILALNCLPRLIAGRELPDFQATPATLTREGRPARPSLRADPSAASALTTIGVLVLFAASILRLTRPGRADSDHHARAIRHGLLASSAAIIVAFVVNRNIYNSDNYRYLVLLLPAWGLGFGLLMTSIATRGRTGRASALICSALLALGMTSSVADWYRELGWIGDEHRRAPPASAGVPLPVEVTHLFGDYWDVYRTAFLSGGRVAAAPFPTYPNRFPGWSVGLGPDRGALLVRPEVPGWPSMLAESWRREGRDPSELERVSILLP